MDQFDVFISYSHNDVNIVNKIEEEIKHYDISYFIDRKRIHFGEEFPSILASSIENCKLLLFIWSEDSDRSVYAGKEISYAIQLKKHIIPFKVGSFIGIGNLSFSLSDIHRFDYVADDDSLIRDMVADLATILGREKIDSFTVINSVNHTSLLKVVPDVRCSVFIDGDLKCIAEANVITKIELRAGSYNLRFENFCNNEVCKEDFDFSIPADTERMYKVILTDDILTPDELNSTGDKYYYGCGSCRNYARAVEFYTKAAEQGSVRAMNNLGDCYFWGDGVKQNYKTAFMWYGRAAETGDADALNNLGNCYYNGKGVRRNFAMAVECYEQSVRGNCVRAMNSLGNCYFWGNGVGPSYSNALDLYRRAALAGCGEAMLNLSNCYLKGFGVRKDTEISRMLVIAANKENIGNHDGALEILESLFCNDY